MREKTLEKKNKGPGGLRKGGASRCAAPPGKKKKDRAGEACLKVGQSRKGKRVHFKRAVK